MKNGRQDRIAETLTTNCSHISCFIAVRGRFQTSSFFAYVPRIYLSKSNPSISNSANCLFVAFTIPFVYILLTP